MILKSPLSSPLWPQIELGLIKSMAVETCNCELNDVVERIEAEELGVMVSLEAEDIVMGLAILDEDQGWVDVPFFWSAGLEHLNRLMRDIEEVAKLTGVKGVKWCSEREAAESFAEKRGYKRRLVEYVKEV